MEMLIINLSRVSLHPSPSLASVCVVDSERSPFQGCLLDSPGKCHPQGAVSPANICLSYRELPPLRPWPSQGGPHPVTKRGRVERSASSTTVVTVMGSAHPRAPCWSTGALLARVADQLLPLPSSSPPLSLHRC